MKTCSLCVLAVSACLAGCGKKEIPAEKPSAPVPVQPALVKPPPPPVEPVQEVLQDYSLRFMGTEGTPVQGYWMGEGSRPHGDLSVTVPAEIPFSTSEFKGFSLRKMVDEGEVTVMIVRGSDVLASVSAEGTNVILIYRPE